MSDFFSWVDREALIINYSNLINSFLIFFIVYISDSFPLTVAILVILLFVSINEEMCTKISYSLGYFSDPVSSVVTCGKPVAMRFAFQWNLFCFLTQREWITKKTNPKTNPMNSTAANSHQWLWVWVLWFLSILSCWIFFFFSWAVVFSFCLKNPVPT